MAVVAVLGGGVSGLAAAYHLSKPAYKHLVNKVVVLEASSRFGGWVKSDRHKDGALFEAGPRSMRGYGEAGINTLRLVEELGLQDSVLPIGKKHPAASNRYLYVNKKILPLPKGFRGLMFKQPPFSKSLASYIFREPSIPPATTDDESIHDFISRRLGSDLANYAVDPLCRGVFAGSSKQLSIKSCFPPLFNYERESGSLVRGAMFTRKEKAAPEHSELVRKFQSNAWQMWSLRGGLEELITTLVNELKARPHVELLTDSPCTKLEFTEGRAKVTSPHTTIDCDQVFSSCFSKDLSGMLSEEHGALADQLGAIPAVTVGVISLEYPGKVLPVNGFGHLIPSSEPSKVMGVIYESCVFPEHDAQGEPTTRLTCMMGGAWFKELFGDENTVSMSTLETAATESIREQLNINVEPTKVVPTLLKACIPQYVVGHSKKLDAIDGYIKNNDLPLKLVGASYRGVSVNDCIMNAGTEADKYLAKLL